MEASGCLIVSSTRWYALLDPDDWWDEDVAIPLKLINDIKHQFVMNIINNYNVIDIIFHNISKLFIINHN